MKIIAIDPGKSGGIAWMQGQTIYASKMPENVIESLRVMHQDQKIGLVVIEKVQMFMSDNDEPGKVMQMQKLFRGQSELIGALKGMNIPVCEVAPITWQSYLGLGSRKEKLTKPQRKAKYKDYAQAYCPNLKLTLATADAVCILLYSNKRIKLEPNKFKPL